MIKAARAAPKILIENGKPNSNVFFENRQCSPNRPPIFLWNDKGRARSAKQFSYNMANRTRFSSLKIYHFRLVISRERAVLGAVGCFILSPSADESLREIGAVRSLFEFPRSQPSAIFVGYFSGLLLHSGCCPRWDFLGCQWWCFLREASPRLPSGNGFSHTFEIGCCHRLPICSS